VVAGLSLSKRTERPQDTVAKFELAIKFLRFDVMLD